jgi:hypothetical protein
MPRDTAAWEAASWRATHRQRGPGVQPAIFLYSYQRKYELVVNLRTAKALGLTLSPTLLARADEIIE